jgi:predicted PurR-regulated permease PerM
MRQPLPPPWDRIVPVAEKVFVWAMVFGVLWLMRSFFILVFLTFVFGYVLQHFVTRTERLIRSRRLRVVAGFLVLLALLVGLGWTIGPALIQQAKDFPGQVNAQLAKLDELIADGRRRSPALRKMIPEDLRVGHVLAEILPRRGSGRPAETTGAAAGPPVSREALAAAAAGLAKATNGLAALAQGGEGSTTGLASAQEGLAEAAQGLAAAAEESPKSGAGRAPDEEQWKDILPLLISVAERSVAIGSAFLLALLFSFLIVLDLPILVRGARHLHDTRLQFVYDEVSDNVLYFGRVLGRALEAQLMIAVVNTILTAIGLYFLGLPNLAFLSMVVFVCSFIPVAGVFISSVPICLTALAAGGFRLMLVGVGFIIVIHAIEAYILNPRLYGAHLRMNPVLVLGILVISEHLFGVWGLILGVPVVSFVVTYIIELKSGRRDEPVAGAGPGPP